MKKDPNNNYTGSAIISLLLHSVLIGALFWGANVTRVEQQPRGESIKAVVVDPGAVREQANKIRQQRNLAKEQEEKRLQRLKQQSQRLEKQRDEEEQRLKDLKAQRVASEKATRLAEKERKRSIEAKQKAEKSARIAKESARVAKEAAATADRQRKQVEKKRAEDDAKRVEKERKRKIEVKKKAEDNARKAEAARKKAEQKAAEAKRKDDEQKAAFNDIFTALETESQSRTSARGQFIEDEARKWAGKFETMIQKNWLVDSSMDGQTCRLKLRLAADGFVIDVSTLSGDAGLCRSATASVFKVDKFPMPSDPDVVVKLRDLRLNFER